MLGATGSATARLPAAGVGGTYGNLAWFLVAFELGPWEEYLIHELTPDLDRLTDQPTPTVSWIRLDEGILLPDFAAALLQPPAAGDALRPASSRPLSGRAASSRPS